MKRSRMYRRLLPVTALAAGLALTAGLTAASGVTTRTPATASSFTFSLVPSVGIAACLPNASGKATITSTPPNDTMKVTVSGLTPNSSFDLFVIQVPNKPFGVAWYQTGAGGGGSATVRGVFNAETFSVSAGGIQVLNTANFPDGAGPWSNVTG